MAALAVAAPDTRLWRAGGARVATRYAFLAAVVVAVAFVHVRRPATFCVLRAATGVPCPFCGGTTAAADLGRGHPGAAFAASPIAPVLFLAWPWLGVAAGPRWWRSRPARWTAVLTVLALAEVWQLHRFGVIWV